MSERLLYIFNPHSDLALADPTGGELKDDEPKLTWKVVLRTGTWKLRPGPGGTKLDEPLKVFRDKAPKGHISMAELVKSFAGDAKGPAKEHVTYPQVHADGTVSDGGFVRKLVIQDVMGEDGSKTKESLLWAGIEITDSDLKKKVDEKSIVGCSGGILFDYARTEDGKVFPQILSHVMATNSPWINGCGGYETKLPDGVMAAEDQDIARDEVLLDTPLELAPDSASAAAPGTVVWKPEEGLQYIRSLVQRALEDWRRQALSLLPKGSYSYDDFPYMNCDDVSHDGTSGRALICSGYGDAKETWVASFTREDGGDVVVSPFQTWTEAKKEWVAASEEVPTKPAPSAGRTSPPAPKSETEMSDLRRAQLARDEGRVGLSSPAPTTTTGGRLYMGKISDLLVGVDLSDEQRAALSAHEAEEAKKDERLRKAAEDAQSALVTAFMSEMDGLGLGDKDTPGLRVEVRNIMMSDDGGTALNLSEVTESGGRTQAVPQTATDIVRRIINALPRNKDGRVALSEQARVLPGDPKPDEGDKPDDGADDKRDPRAKSDAYLAEFGAELGIPASTNGGGR
jgi:hypothetical protein